MNCACTASRGRLGEALLLGGRVAAPLRQPPRGLGRLLRLRLAAGLPACRARRWIWLTAVLMNVAGPYTTFAGFRSAISRQTGGRLPSPFLLSGTLPARQPSSRSTPAEVRR